MGIIETYSSEIKIKEKNLEATDKLMEKEKMKLISLLNKTEDIIDDLKLNDIKNSDLRKTFFQYLNLLFSDIDLLLKNEITNKKETLWKLENSLNNVLTNYKEFAKNHSWYIDTFKWYCLWIKEWIINVSKYIKNDILWLIDFFSDVDNIKKIPQFVDFLVDNFNSILENVSWKAKQELKNIKNELLSLDDLHNKKEISDKLYYLKVSSLTITFIGITAYELLPFGKITKIKKIEDLENVLKESIKSKNINKHKIHINNNLKQKIHKEFSKNFPLLSIERLAPDSKIYNITFTWWIKKLNDKYWQSNVDLLINEIQDHFISLNSKNRIVRKNYKHLTIDALDNKNIDLWWTNSPDIVKSIIEKNKKTLKRNFLKNKKIDKLDNLVDNFDDFVKDSITNIKFWIWTANVKWNNLKDKLNAFYQAEISARWGNWEKVEIIKYNTEKIEKLAFNVLKIEKEIVLKYDNKKFFYNWKDYDIITLSPNWQKTINPILLRFIRKDKNIVDEKWKKMEELINLTKSYTNNLNSWFDFIAPYIDLNKDIKFIKKLNNQIRKWKISISNFLQDFKWNIPKWMFFDFVKQKSWSAYFIDVKDMWILNLNDFKKIAEDIHKKWIKNIELTSSWKSVTWKFVSFVKNLKKEDPNLKIALWWDEIYIYSNKYSNLEEIISKNMHSVWFNGRITKYKWEIWENTFSHLDKATWIIKEVETPIEYYFNKLNEFIPNITLNNIKWLDLSKNIEDMDINIKINENLIKDILNWKNVVLWKCEWKQLFGKLEKNNLNLSLK